MWEHYAHFISSDNAFRDAIGQFQGSGSADWSEDSISIMLQFYIYAFNNFIHAYPEKFKTVTDASELDQQLNVTYKEIQQQINKIPNSNMYKKDINTQLISAEKFWIAYRNAFVELGKLYYGNKYQMDEIQHTLTRYLTRRRLAELKDQLETIKGNLVYHWYNNPS